jgi:hypothetical protein
MSYCISCPIDTIQKQHSVSSKLLPIPNRKSLSRVMSIQIYVQKSFINRRPGQLSFNGSRSNSGILDLTVFLSITAKSASTFKYFQEATINYLLLHKVTEFVFKSSHSYPHFC